MNCPSRVDDTTGHPGYNQNPPPLAADLTTVADLNKVEDSKNRSDVAFEPRAGVQDGDPSDSDAASRSRPPHAAGVESGSTTPHSRAGRGGRRVAGCFNSPGMMKVRALLSKYGSFMGPGFMVAVSYIDPGNYSTGVAAGAQFRFAHLFAVFMANVFAIFLQALCVKLGSVTGTDLATNCKENLPLWLNLILYFFAECAIIATDLAEILGFAIALNILLKIPLVAGVAISMSDVIVILYMYRPSGPLKAFRYFELGITALAMGVVICLCIELSKIRNTTFDEVMRGFLPSKTVATGSGLYLSCGILGATVMPHSLYLGSGIVQPRLRDYDIRKGYADADDVMQDQATVGAEKRYRPSLAAIQYTMGFCIADLAISLATAALFVNSAILIVSGATLSDTPGAADADLYSIHDLLSKSIGAGAGTIFALALLLSGQSSGIIVTLAGQMVCEGHLNWTLRPWLRRLITRAIAVAPCIAVAASLGREGIAVALNASQVCLSILLPFLAAPLVWFTCRTSYMRVPAEARLPHAVRAGSSSGEQAQSAVTWVDLSNGWIVTIAAVLIWIFIAALNVYNIVEIAKGGSI